MPPMRAVPLSGFWMVQRMCPRVVLPAPLGPSRANNSFARTVKPTLSSASVRPNRLLTPSISAAGPEMFDNPPPCDCSGRRALTRNDSVPSFYRDCGKFVAVQDGLEGPIGSKRRNRLIDVVQEKGLVRQ